MQHKFSALALMVAIALAGADVAAADPQKPAATKPSTAAPASTPDATKASKPAKKPKPVDVNSASAEQLKTVPGVDDARAEKIIRNRPYPTRAYLVTKDVYAQDEYYKVKDYFVAAPPAGAKSTTKK